MNGLNEASKYHINKPGHIVVSEGIQQYWVVNNKENSIKRTISCGLSVSKKMHSESEFPEVQFYQRCF
jgi:hypothetical protein